MAFPALKGRLVLKNGERKFMQRIKGLDGLRAIAAILVVLTHAGVLGLLPEGSWRPMLSAGAAVQLFFVLSGFLITHLLIKENAEFGAINVKYFFCRRAYRIAPAYFLVVLFITAVDVFACNVTSEKGLPFAFLYIYNFIPNAWYSPMFGHLWSLAVEEHFYLAWPFLFYFFYRANDNGLRLLKISAVLLCASLAFYPCMRMIPAIAENFRVHGWTFSVGYNLLLGCCAAIVINHPSAGKVILSQLRKTYAIIAFAALWCFPLIPTGAPSHVVVFLRGVAFTLLVCWVFANQQSLGVRLLEFRPMRYLGQVSYGIYIYQGIFLSTGPYRAPGQVWPPSPVLGLILLAFFVPLSYHGFESKMIARGKRFRQRREDAEPRRCKHCGQSLPAPSEVQTIALSNDSTVSKDRRAG